MTVVVEHSYRASARNSATGEVREFGIRPSFSFATKRWTAVHPSLATVGQPSSTPTGAIDDLLKRNGWGPVDEALVTAAK